MEPTQELDTNLYSRQIGTFGLEAMGKLIKLKVLIVGMRGLGVETAKNLILAGPASVDIYDPTVARVNDLGSNFYIREADVGKKSRAEASVSELRDLNPYVKVNVIQSLSMEDHSNYNVVCYTENLTSIANLMEVNAFCRDKNIGFVLTETLGLLGYAFVDYGENHKIFDHNGENTKSFMVVSISNEERATVMVHEDKRHSYEEGDYVSFIEVEGLKPEINGHAPIKIVNVKGPYSF
jgi:ubiquitin-activating enzyme E1